MKLVWLGTIRFRLPEGSKAGKFWMIWVGSKYRVPKLCITGETKAGVMKINPRSFELGKFQIMLKLRPTLISPRLMSMASVLVCDVTFSAGPWIAVHRTKAFGSSKMPGLPTNSVEE
jgi:hypothetical protein